MEGLTKKKIKNERAKNSLDIWKDHVINIVPPEKKHKNYNYYKSSKHWRKYFHTNSAKNQSCSFIIQLSLYSKIMKVCI